MSLDELMAEAGRALGGARRLFGRAPADGRWSSTQALSTSREAVGQAARAAGASWSGNAAEGYGIAAGGQRWALDSTIGADNGTGPPVTGSGQAAADGGGAMDGVIGDARSGVAAIAPATGTPAGKQELVRHLQGQLDRARDLLKVSEQRNMELAALIERGSAGYNPAAAANPMGGVMGGGMPMGLGGGGGGLGSGFSIPGLDSLTGLTGNHHHANPRADDEGLTLAANEPSGPGPERERAAIDRALDIKGIHDPAARARWEAGMMLVTKRESTYNSGAENDSDGDPAVGSYQFKLATFRSYHEPGTADDRKDNVAAACAFINYARGRYHVAADASNLAANIQQADPTRPAAPY
ncbi:lytic transglycosylase [Mycobacterium sp. 663a-19]|uniref:lytic transglycosylase n=1 Tax=Mycobacterium sp. 663a-19 TaxID=2986148 RepID=UPI002D1E7DA8|nr:lytic transglycosylase [Mycobacterium sp. 663a-19]MEB3980143.1 lytic transglycosylase [Mycobacterium sp. 663a-19]